MARDFAKTRKTAGGNPRRGAPPNKSNQRSRGSAAVAAPAGRTGSSWRAYLAGLLSGIFLSFLLYLANLPAADAPAAVPEPAAVSIPAEPPKPRFDFYTMLPEQTMDGAVEPAELADPPPGVKLDVYVLQAGSFRQREDADRRRAELLLLGLQPSVEEADSDNGRWFRVYLGPYSTHQEMTRARSLTAAQDIDTLPLKRGAP